MVRMVLVILALIYLGGMIKFLQGFRRTNFNRSLPNKIMLSLFWPVLLAVNSSYRKNFQKALKS